MFHADGRTDMTMVTVAFRNFKNAQKNTWRGPGMAPTLLLMRTFFCHLTILPSHYPNTHLILLILPNGYGFILHISPYLAGQRLQASH